MAEKFETYESEETVFHPSVQSPDGEVKNYELVTKIEFPCYVMNTNGGIMPEYRIQVLKNNLEPSKYIKDGVPEGYFIVYLINNGKVSNLGLVHTDSLKALISNSLYRDLEKYILLDYGNRVDGDMMLSYCTIPNL